MMECRRPPEYLHMSVVTAQALQPATSISASARHALSYCPHTRLCNDSPQAHGYQGFSFFWAAKCGCTESMPTKRGSLGPSQGA
ncbi:hypothetical protein SCLCIDRAFT_1096861 [Scleroderma citrinum Foug A]|uniref:Uncharacterized protein n=1 Tax=Scleroderma citrinum Foug A TaxID=1036808 RepID=A0A0C3DCE1_9AGAM|nr:hypothetical protein SCLCIDRAFT_1096861 [Scleroderma citrinum Foug A]